VAGRNQHIIDAIIKELEFGADRGKALAKVGKAWQLSTRTFDRLWKEANRQHTERKQAIKKELDAVDTAEAIKARKMAIMSANERKEYLTKIIKGQIKVKRPFVIAGEIKEFAVEPDQADRLKAIAELNKMEGDYAPAKTEITGKDGEALLPDKIKITFK